MRFAPRLVLTVWTDRATRAFLRRVLARRQLTPSQNDDPRIEACTDLETLERWLDRASNAASVCATPPPRGDRTLPVDAAVAERWGRLNVPDPIPAVDGLLAATALVHSLTLVTRNVRDVWTTGVRHLDPFA